MTGGPTAWATEVGPIPGIPSIVGAPIATLLKQHGAQVESCNSRTPNVPEKLKNADVIVSATGCPYLVKPDSIKPNALIVDVGITRTASGLAGDVDPACADVAGLQTAVPGGVGPMTITSLFTNLIDAAYMQSGRPRPVWDV